MIDTIAGKDRGLGLLETSHDLLSVSNLPVHSLHLAVVPIPS